MNEEDRQHYEMCLRKDVQDLSASKADVRDPVKDKDGGATNMLALTLRDIGVTRYLLYDDVAAFRRDLSESTRLQRTLFERYEAGEPIDPSYITILDYKSALDALAACDFDGAGALCEHLRPLHAESEHDRGDGTPLTMGLGYTVRAAVLDDDPQELSRACKFFLDLCKQRKDCRNFAGYAELLGLRPGDTDEDDAYANTILMEIVRGHQRESKGNGLFALDMDRFLCVWGIGVVNLARRRGLNVEAYPPLIPANLLL